MKKRKLVCLALAAAVLAFALSCHAKPRSAVPESQAAPADSAAPSGDIEGSAQPTNIDSTKSAEIDKLLDRYAAVVDAYLKASAKDGKADEDDLADVSAKLGELAKDFDADQLKKYNAITAKLSGEGS